MSIASARGQRPQKRNARCGQVRVYAAIFDSEGSPNDERMLGSRDSFPDSSIRSFYVVDAADYAETAEFARKDIDPRAGTPNGNSELSARPANAGGGRGEGSGGGAR